jgi:hypothetical protein
MNGVMSHSGPLQRKALSPWNVGNQGKSGLVVLNVSFVARDPNRNSSVQICCDAQDRRTNQRCGRLSSSA